MSDSSTSDVEELDYERDPIVRAALRACVQTALGGLVAYSSSHSTTWTGDTRHGAVINYSGSDGYEVIAWNEAGVVGLAYERGFGSIEQLGLSTDAVTGGPDDVRGAVPGLPEELEPVFVRAVGLLETGTWHRTGKGDEVVCHGEKLAGVGFWLHGDRLEGTLFTDVNACGADRLATWGLLQGNRLPHACGGGEIHFHPDEPEEVPFQAIVDAVTARAFQGPTELTAEEIKTLVPQPEKFAGIPGLKLWLDIRRSLQKMNIAWPGMPPLPLDLPHIDRPDRSVNPATSVGRHYGGGEYVVFDHQPIVRAALCACLENIFARLDPLHRHPVPTSIDARWRGTPQRGAFYNGDEDGNYDVVAWTEAGVVGFAYERVFGPNALDGSTPNAANDGLDKVRAALPDLPAALEPAVALAADLLAIGEHGEKLVSVGCWLSGNRVEGTLFDRPVDSPSYFERPGVARLKMWGHLRWGWLWRSSWGHIGHFTNRVGSLVAAQAAPLQLMANLVANRALQGPTKLLPDELALLFPTALDPERQRTAQEMLYQAGIELPAHPQAPAIGRTHLFGYVVMNQAAIVRAALRAYVEKILSWLDPAQRHDFPICDNPIWVGDLQRGAFGNDTGWGHFHVVAWTEAGVVGLAYEGGNGPIERFGLAVDAITGGPDDVRAALPELPAALELALSLAAHLLPTGSKHGEKLASVGFWFHGDRIEGTLFDAPESPGAKWLVPWGLLLGGRRHFRLLDEFSSYLAEMERRFGAPIQAIVDALVDRRLQGPTALTTDEIATLLPVPIDQEILMTGQRMLQQVGITWPELGEIA